ncbi:UMP-CMP kinase, partial [Cladochytrium tenue]
MAYMAKKPPPRSNSVAGFMARLSAAAAAAGHAHRRAPAATAAARGSAVAQGVERTSSSRDSVSKDLLPGGPPLVPERMNSTETIDEPPLVVLPSAEASMDHYNHHHHSERPFLIAIAGGAASGKTEVCRLIKKLLTGRRAKRGTSYVKSMLPIKTKPARDNTFAVAVINLEDFYRELTPAERTLLPTGRYNFDHPDALDFHLFEQCLVEFASGRSFAVPTWDLATHKRIPAKAQTPAPDVLIAAGTLALYKKRIRDFFDLRIFVDVDSDTRLANQVIRDTETRVPRKTLEEVLSAYLEQVKPCYEDFVFPTKKFADVIIPRGAENEVAIELIAKHISDILAERGVDDAVSLTSSANASPRI